jgi:hypothetical protein
MHKVFYGTLLSNAKYQLKNLEHLIIRAEHGFLPVKSIDQAIEDLQKTHTNLLKAKESYIQYHRARESQPPTQLI